MEKYTVIIPTRDRAETLGATIQTCLRQTYENFEIIISDNCSDDNTKEIVSQFKDARIKYINPGKRLSMSGNFEFALGHVTEGFVMFIGSDDGIMPDAISYVDSIVKKYNVDAVSCFQAYYNWPNFQDKKVSGNLMFRNLGMGVDIRKSREWINRALSFDDKRFCHDLPNLYAGFVHKRVIDKAYKDGVYFRSITPDAYSAFVTSIFIDKYAFSMRPFSIAGQSGKSNGVSTFIETSNKNEVSKFYSENDIDFFDGFVNCPSFQIILGETFAQVRKAFPAQCINYEINFKSMLNNSLRDMNKKTEMEVKAAVEIMAENFSVNLRDDSATVKFKKNNFLEKFKSLCNLLFHPTDIIAIKKSYLIGINDVNDAALAMHLFMNLNKTNLVISRRKKFLNKMKSLFRLFVPSFIKPIN